VEISPIYDRSTRTPERQIRRCWKGACLVSSRTRRIGYLHTSAEWRRNKRSYWLHDVD